MPRKFALKIHPLMKIAATTGGERMKCLRCGKPIDETEAKIIEEAGVDPFCSEYCELIYGGVPLPYSQGDDFVIDVINGDYFKRKGYVVENGRWVKLD